MRSASGGISRVKSRPVSGSISASSGHFTAASSARFRGSRSRLFSDVAALGIGACGLSEGDSLESKYLELIKEYDAAGKLVCAICAAPALVLTAAGILPGRPATCYPAPDFTAALGTEYRREKAVVSGNLITAEGPGRFKDFARAIIVKVKGEEAARQTFADALLED